MLYSVTTIKVELCKPWPCLFRKSRNLSLQSADSCLI